MPNLMTIFGYHVYFWSNENYPLEPIHVHISKSPHNNATKVWILDDGTCLLENNNDNIPSKNLKAIMNTIESFSDEIIEKWKEHFNEITFKNNSDITLE